MLKNYKFFKKYIYIKTQPSSSELMFQIYVREERGNGGKSIKMATIGVIYKSYSCGIQII